MAGEELEGGGRGPLLAHEQHGGERPGQGQQRCARELVGVEGFGDPVAHRPGCRSGRGSGCRRRAARSAWRAVSIGTPVVAARGRTTRCRRGRTPARRPSRAHREARSRRSSPAVSPVSATCRAWWKSSLHWPSSPWPPASRGRDQARVVQVGLGDQRQRAAAGAPRARRPRSPSPRADDGGVVDERVHGIEAQPVDVVVRAATSARCRGCSGAPRRTPRRRG